MTEELVYIIYLFTTPLIFSLSVAHDSSTVPWSGRSQHEMRRLDDIKLVQPLLILLSRPSLPRGLCSNMSSILYLVLAAVVLRGLWSFVPKKRTNPGGLALPPGPKGIPVMGNHFDLVGGRQWLTFDKWFKKYGDIVYFELLGQKFIVLGSSKRADDLFAKRSSVYSFRQKTPYLTDVIDFDFNFFLLSYGTWWRRHRRAFHDYFHPNVVSKYHPVQIREVRAFLRRLLTTPEDFSEHIRFYFASVIMDVVYGTKIQGMDNPFMRKVEEAMAGFSEGAVYGKFWVDLLPSLLPFMKYVPSWVPGARYKKAAEKWKRASNFVQYNAFESVKEDLAKGNNRPCVVAEMLESLPEGDKQARDEAEAVFRRSSATAYIGGADTTLSAVKTFFMAMAKYPDVQRKAQAEIDQVIGHNRLPDFNDKQSLPYISAMTKEIMRWQPVVPNVGHMAGSDDEYDGYFIPKGTIVIGNSWSILQDPEMYPEPQEFRPERFLKGNGSSPVARDPDAAFGYGRRICPGRFFSDNALFIMVASVLAVYDITPPTDEHGNPVQLNAEYTDGFLVHPRPFKCVIKPRSQNAEALIRATEMEHEDSALQF
ncbi:hypothetical protein AX17_004780 [Amanita inopinata Kibby_2008]|nr:hypothetical protein AX17_004780 [Amanita inopinata Kibby_2008]